MVESESESEVAQSCLTLCYPVDCSPPGSSVHGIFQARILERVAIYARNLLLKREKKKNIYIYIPCMLRHFSPVQLCVTLWTVACQVPLFVGFSRQEYWSGSPFPSLGELPNTGIKPMSLMCPALAGGFFTTKATWEAPYKVNI